MGVYIKGIEMPKKCSCCFAAFPDGVGYSCCMIKSFPPIDNQKGRRSDCPLTPVPPHGRLGDLDKLHDNMLSLTAGLEHRGEVMHEVRRAPTIIPAEEA